jgi:hypothetical protein
VEGGRIAFPSADFGCGGERSRVPGSVVKAITSMLGDALVDADESPRLRLPH